MIEDTIYAQFFTIIKNGFVLMRSLMESVIDLSGRTNVNSGSDPDTPLLYPCLMTGEGQLMKGS